MKVKLIKILKSKDRYYQKGAYIFVDEFSNISNDIEKSEVVEEFTDIPQNMSLHNGSRAETLHSLIDKQRTAIQQCKTQIRRLPIREDILRRLIVLTKFNESKNENKRYEE